MNISTLFAMRTYLCAILLASQILFAQAKFSLPYQADYGGRGIRMSSLSVKDLKSKYNEWKQDYFVTSGGSARVVVDPNSQETSSEGIGFGMLLTVYFGDQNAFDLLWQYSKQNLNQNGLMRYRVASTGTALINSAYTGPDILVAMALQMAHFQFGKAQYLEDAKNQVAKIWEHEVDPTFYLREGDYNTSNAYVPGHFSPSAIELFKSISIESWQDVLDSNYKAITANAGALGLVSDLIRITGSGHQLVNFSDEAVKNPWHLAMAYLWFGDEKAKVILDKLGVWASGNYGSDASKIFGPLIAPTGLPAQGAYRSLVFFSSIACGLVSTPEAQGLMDDIETEVRSSSPRNYYEATLQLLAALLLSGNMPNLATYAIPQSSEALSSSEYVSSSSLHTTRLNQAEFLGLPELDLENRQLVLPDQHSFQSAAYYDHQGRLVALQNLNSNRHFPISVQNPGAYFLVLRTRTGEMVTRMLLLM